MTFIKGLFRNTRHLTLNNLKEKLRQVLHPFRGRNKIILRCDMNYAGEKKKIYIHSSLRDDSIQFQSYNEIFFPDFSFCCHDNLHSIFPFVTGIFFFIGILILWVGTLDTESVQYFRKGFHTLCRFSYGGLRIMVVNLINRNYYIILNIMFPCIKIQTQYKNEQYFCQIEILWQFY